MQVDKFALVVAGLACLILLGVGLSIYEVKNDLVETQAELYLARLDLDTADLKLRENDGDLLSKQETIDKLNERTRILEESIDPESSKWAKIRKVREAVRISSELGGFNTGFKTTDELTEYAKAVVSWSEEYDVPIALSLALARKESAFHNGRVSHAGAIGIMQVMPNTGADVILELGDRHLKLARMKDNTRIGIRYISKMLDRFDRNFDLAIRAYNCGPEYTENVVAGIFNDYPSETKCYARAILGSKGKPPLPDCRAWDNTEGYLYFYEQLGL